MRLISKTPEFPWNEKTISYIYFDKNLNSYQVGSNRDISHENAYQLAKSGEGKIIAVWPGNYRSDAFLIDDLNLYGLQFGCVKNPLPIKIVGYIHDNPFNYDTKQTKYISFFYEGTDGDITRMPNFLERLSDMLYDKFGWKIAMGKGYSSAYYNEEHKGNISVFIYRMGGKEIKNSWGKTKIVRK